MFPSYSGQKKRLSTQIDYRNVSAVMHPFSPPRHNSPHLFPAATHVASQCTLWSDSTRAGEHCIENIIKLSDISVPVEAITTTETIKSEPFQLSSSAESRVPSTPPFPRVGYLYSIVCFISHLRSGQPATTRESSMAWSSTALMRS